MDKEVKTARCLTAELFNSRAVLQLCCFTPNNRLVWFIGVLPVAKLHFFMAQP